MAESCSFSSHKGEVCACTGKNATLSECNKDISRHVQTYGLGKIRDEIRDEVDLILCRTGK